MDSLLFALGAVTPIILMIALGYGLKRLGWMPPDFAKKTNKLVFHLFLPTMLFLNVYNIRDAENIDCVFILYVVGMLLVLFGLTLPAVLAVEKVPERRGVLLQASFRSNYALIGLPLAQSLFGAEGVAIAAVVSAAVIPTLNILAVISLSVFKNQERINVKHILVDIVKNPLIQAVALGLAVLGIRGILASHNIDFRISDVTPIFKVIEYLSSLATPLALLVLGAQFEFSNVKELKKEICFGTLMRTCIAPLFGIGLTYLMFSHQFDGARFATLVAVFCTPVSVSSVPMAQEMKGDAVLAGQLVVWTTLLSAFSVFLVSLLLKIAGIF